MDEVKSIVNMQFQIGANHSFDLHSIPTLGLYYSQCVCAVPLTVSPPDVDFLHPFDNTVISVLYTSISVHGFFFFLQP